MIFVGVLSVEEDMKFLVFVFLKYFRSVEIFVYRCYLNDLYIKYNFFLLFLVRFNIIRKDSK